MSNNLFISSEWLLFDFETAGLDTMCVNVAADGRVQPRSDGFVES